MPVPFATPRLFFATGTDWQTCRFLSPHLIPRGGSSRVANTAHLSCFSRTGRASQIAFGPRHLTTRCSQLAILSQGPLDTYAAVYSICSMGVETIGEALSLGWRVVARCVRGCEDGPSSRSSRECTYRRELDLETLVCTRGREFPLSRLESRLRCPRCGNRRMVVMFEPPTRAAVG